MDGALAVSGGGVGGGPAPFLLKTYEMVDDTKTDEIVSWSPSMNSFIVWNTPEFARLLLPTYFKHNNFSSFIRQLNTYGFRKIDPERWEFANEDFAKDKKHLLKNIHRRKPIHSHSHPPVDPERAAFEEEMEKLLREKNELEAQVLKFRNQQSTAKLELEDITQRIGGMEQRQENLLSSSQKAIHNHTFIEHVAQKIESMDVSAYTKKRRLPQVDHFQPVAENNSGDNQSSSRPELVNVFQQDFSNKLKLELSTAVSSMNLVSNSTQSSSEDWASPPRRLSEGEPRDAQIRTSSLPFAAEAIELSDNKTPREFNLDSSLSQKGGAKENSGLQLNLTLASSPFQANQSHLSTKVTPMDKEGSRSAGPKPDSSGNQAEFGANLKTKDVTESAATLSSSQEAPTNNQGPTAGAARVNDYFWEQFLTERPGSSDTEEASSSYRANPHDEQEDKCSSHGMSRTAKNLGNLTL